MSFIWINLMFHIRGYKHFLKCSKISQCCITLLIFLPIAYGVRRKVMLSQVSVNRGGRRYLPPPPRTKEPTPPPARSRRGRRGTPRYLPPRIGQHMEYLICRGRYASCVHAGGLSCFHFLTPAGYFEVRSGLN